ncbi:uncharacterized protein BJ171DRAFT_603810 [Polychytrium aggregatum]|uniref:uncharacterized protein n=1 Tax=Polychytrium aggregatum TaxID=110093 RepID=UPI0022FDE033|nr:uncharacterized protein BJ171DRAFT_603810 [Polychytrium aggregatum]KAI9193350.1 hypothetical protein BJ171DRAFT_603810 [Polychytrium aggregatum]
MPVNRAADAPRHRFIAAVSFGSLVAAEIAHFASYCIGSGSLPGLVPLGLWFTVWLVYATVIYQARIPLLHFNLTTISLMYIGMAILTMSIAGVTKSRFCWRGEVEFDEMVSPASPFSILGTEHIKGHHRVNLLKPTQAKMNKDKHTFCLTNETGYNTARIPIFVRGQGDPWRVDYEVYGPDGSFALRQDAKLITIDEPAISSDKKTKKGTYYIEVDRVGVYRLLEIREASGNKGKVYLSFATVVECPSAVWFNVDRIDPHQCYGNVLDYNVKVIGVPPLTVSYASLIGPEHKILTVEGLDVPPEQQPGENQTVPETIEAKIQHAVALSKPKEIVIPIDMKLNKELPHSFNILNVTDGFGNTYVYSDIDGEVDAANAADMPLGRPNRTCVAGRRIRDAFDVDVHGAPKAQFMDCASNLRIIPGVRDQVNLKIKLEGSGPWTLSYASTDSYDAISKIPPEDEIVITSTSDVVVVPVARSGVYALRSIRDKYCPGDFGRASVCMIEQTVPPAAEIRSEAILHSCIGEVGALVNISLTGLPPFWITYEQVFNGMPEVKRISIPNSRHQIELKPSVPGSYEYRFLKVGDQNYEAGVPIEDAAPITQTIHPQSTVEFAPAQPQKVKKCTGDMVKEEIELTLGGEGPWNIVYEVMYENQKQRHELKGVRDRQAFIGLGKLDSAGTYVIELVEMVDKNNCPGILKPKYTVSVEVLGQRPTSFFNCMKPLPLLEGSTVKIPIQSNGGRGSPYTVRYARRDAQDKIFEAKVKPSSFIEVDTPGVWELLSVKDEYCSGVVINPKECSVQTVEKPKLLIPADQYKADGAAPYVLDAVCQGDSDAIEVTLSGNPRFAVHYSHQSPDHSDWDQLSAEFITRNGRIRLSTEASGLHTYQFTGITDDNYKQKIPTLRTDGGELVLQQLVLDRPRVTFPDGKEKVFPLIGGDKNAEFVEIEFFGQPPFSAAFEIQEGRKVPFTDRIDGIETHKYHYRPRIFDSAGKYKIRALEVGDSTKCDSKQEDSSSIEVIVYNMAKIRPFSLEGICLTESIVYSLEGTPPFWIHYSINDGPESIVVARDDVLKLTPTEAGRLKIIKLCIHDDKSCTFPNDIVHDIYQIPTVVMTEGDTDLREGDEAEIRVSLTGVPPYSFTYTVDSSQDSVTIESVTNSYYDIITTQGGLFTVVDVKDKYCGVRRTARGEETIYSNRRSYSAAAGNDT